jgi:methyl-accepting chemotaxis protein
LLKKIGLSAKVQVLVVGLVAVASAAVGVASYFTSRESLNEIIQGRLQTAIDAGKSDLEDYLAGIQTDLELVSQHPGTVAAAKEFAATWQFWSELGGQPSVELRQAYIENNPHPVGEKQKLDAAQTGSGYDQAHLKYHPWFRKLHEDRGYYDVFLFNPKGDLVYSVFKELDFATNFAAGGGEWADTDLGRVYRDAMATPDRPVFRDFNRYGPSGDAPASFVAQAIVDDQGKVAGVLAYQLPIDRINRIMAQDLGLGETGELILVGQDGLLRSSSKTTSEEVDILQTRLELPLIDASLDNGAASGTAAIEGGTEFAIEGAAMEFLGSRFVVLAVESVEEASRTLVTMRNRMLLTGLGLLAVATLVGIFSARSITRPINRIAQAMMSLADGKLNVKLPMENRGDEIGDMFRAVSIFKENAVARSHLEKMSQSERGRERRRQAHLDEVISKFRSAMTSRLEMVAGQMELMRQSSSALDELAEQSFRQSSAASESTTTASQSVTSVATATEQLTSTVQEIARQTESTSVLVDRTVEEAADANRNVMALSEVAERIGGVVSLIRDIAEQTNLLALNATIEAARAGELGRGFAVVASEVKELAEQTSKATDEISSQIDEVQDSVRRAVGSIENIGARVGEVRSLTTVVAGAVEEQHVSTQDIAQSAQDAASGTGVAATNMNDVAAAIQQTRGEAGTVNTATFMVAETSKGLASDVETFLKAVTEDVEDRRLALRVPGKGPVSVEDARGNQHVATLIDISVSGAQISKLENLAIEDDVTLIFGGARAIGGKIVRESENGFGIAFEQQLEEDDHLLAA